MGAAFKFHEACLAAPPASEADYAALKDDIAKVGVIEPILIHKGKVLDGRHRIKACEELGIEITNTITDDELREHGGDPWAFVWSTLQGKHLTLEQRAMFAAERNLRSEKVKAKDRQKRKPKSVMDSSPEQNGTARDKAGAATGVSGRTVSRCANILDKGCQQLQEAVRANRVSIALAEQVAKSLPIEQQEEAVAVALLDPKPATKLREFLPQKDTAKEANWESEADKLLESLRGKLDKWPKEYLSLARFVFNTLLQEYGE